MLFLWNWLSFTLLWILLQVRRMWHWNYSLLISPSLRIETLKMGDLPNYQFPKTIIHIFLNVTVSVSLGEAEGKTGRWIIIKARSEIVPSLCISSFAGRRCWIPSCFHSLLLCKGPLMSTWSKPKAHRQNSPEFQCLHLVLNPSLDLKRIKEVCPCTRISLDG